MSERDDYPNLYDAGAHEWSGEEARAALCEIDLLRSQVAMLQREVRFMELSLRGRAS